MKKTILFIYKESVGELNVALPIIEKLIKLINDNKNLDVYFYIDSNKNLKKIDNTYKNIMNDMGKILVGNFSFFILLKKLINKQLYLISSDKCPKFEYMQIRNFFPSSTKILCLHAPVVFFKEKNEKTKSSKTINEIYQPDFFLINNKIDYNNDYFSYNKYSIEKNKLLFIGSLNYKEDWIKYLLSKETNNLNLENYCKKFEKIILITTRGEHKTYLEKKDYIYQVNSIIEIAKIFSNYLFVIKPHPREKRKIYKNAFINSKDLDNLILTTENTYTLCTYADLVISFWSSVIQDCAVIKKPVIEFHKHSKKNSEMLIIKNNKLMSFYEYYNFCKHTDNKEELIELIKENNNNNIQNKDIEDIFFIPEEDLYKKLKKIIDFKKNQPVINNFSKIIYLKNLMKYSINKKNYL